MTIIGPEIVTRQQLELEKARRNAIIEECAKAVEACEPDPNDPYDIVYFKMAAAIRALKEKP